MCSREPGGKWIDAGPQPVLIDVDNQLAAEFLGATVAELDHFAKFPGRIDVEQRERQRGRIKCLDGEVQQNGAVFADGIEQYRIVRGGEHLAKDVDALGFQALEMGQGHQRTCRMTADRRIGAFAVAMRTWGRAAGSGNLTDGRKWRLRGRR